MDKWERNGRLFLITEEKRTMPGIDFSRLRAEIPMEQVLHLLRFQPAKHTGNQWYGCCPLHDCASSRRRAFSVNVETGRYYCHECKSYGNQLELWATMTGLPFRDAAIDLCHAMGREVPWIHRW